MPLDPRARRLLDMVALNAGGSAAAMSAAERRAGFAALMALARRDVPIGRVEETSVAGAAGPLPARIYTPLAHAQGRGPGLVFFHGGGLVAGDLDTHDTLCRRLANEAGCRLIAVAYRRAPEHPFPAAAEDAVAATRAVLAAPARFGLDPERIAVAGDSAGGTLAAVAAAALKGDRTPSGRPALRFQLLLCPVLDLAERRPSRLAYGAGYMLDQTIMDRDLRDYVPDGLDPADPRVSPLHADDLSGRPPALIHTAEFDPVRDEGQDFAQALRTAGVAAQHTCHPGLIHHFLGLEALLPAATPVLAAIGVQARTAFATAP